jgi:hypothetical protein
LYSDASFLVLYDYVVVRGILGESGEIAADVRLFGAGSLRTKVLEIDQVVAFDLGPRARLVFDCGTNGKCTTMPGPVVVLSIM